MKECIGIINLDEKEGNISELICDNIISAMPIAGRYKIIDFILSNLTNSGIECIGIFTKKKSYSLLKHLSNGRPWDLHRKKDGLRVFNYSDYNPIYDDINSFIENIEFIKFSRKEYIIIAPSYMICNINYKEALEKHKKSSNDITIIYKGVNDSNRFSFCEKLIIDDNNRVKEIKNINNKDYKANINMEMYIMKTSIFINIVKESIMSGLYRKVKDYIKDNLNLLRVGTYEFKGYLTCINSISSYFNANKDLLDMNVNKELFYNNNPIFTKQKDEPPVFYSKKSNITNSIIANGSYIEGNLENCILGRKVIVKEGAIIKNSILMDNVIIHKNAIINNSIITHKTIIKENQIIDERNKNLQIV
ncbi:glucose-1-phosphate adenylyltransferase subunit GlgD [Clostridium sp. Sa3CUN1]|uniref:Glucose-1-phosphate adenylyltransferase subunit GlgD n=1 Tax=Clostridium gallinarum TaxID=2762246 RepID=A0ABR8Q862_9CLOT|nr:glucose-1-phosphate adenylyltransferase subunit GlgD [Clostridium gallinarum]MBD7916616.1 glucose-1-phosphate adenylyltransferase subunit GlgD [Clostridium gallinarum]